MPKPTKAATAKKVTPAKSRMLKPPKYKAFRLNKRIKHPGPKLPSAFAIFMMALKGLKKYWRRFLGIVAVYFFLSLVLVKGVSGIGDISGLKTVLDQAFHGKGAGLPAGVTVFGVLLGTAGQTSSQAGGIYQTFLLVAVSLVVIWALRQAQAQVKFTVKEAFYKAFYPLVPFMAVVLMIGLQLLPLLLANLLYNAVFAGGAAITAPERFVWAVFLALLALWSLYMITSSVFALYIVTLPSALPMHALRSARDLVRYRRWTVMRKLIFLPVALLVVGAVIMLPIIMLIPFLAVWVFFALVSISLVVAHSYVYALYRELL